MEAPQKSARSGDFGRPVMARLKSSLQSAPVFIVSGQMPNRVVTAYAIASRSLLRAMRADRFGNFLMAFPAGAVGDFPVMWFDLDRLVKPAGGECERMPEPIRGFVDVFGNEARRCVAVVARRDGAMG